MAKKKVEAPVVNETTPEIDVTEQVDTTIENEIEESDDEESEDGVEKAEAGAEPKAKAKVLYAEPTFPQASENEPYLLLSQIAIAGNVRKWYSDIIPLAYSIAFKGLLSPLVTIRQANDCLEGKKEFTFAIEDKITFKNVFKPGKLAGFNLVDGHRRDAALWFLQHIGISVEVSEGVYKLFKLPADYRVKVTEYTGKIETPLERANIQVEYGTTSASLSMFDKYCNMMLQTFRCYAGTTKKYKAVDIARDLANYGEASVAAMQMEVGRSKRLMNFLLEGNVVDKNPSDITDYFSENGTFIADCIQRNILANTSVLKIANNKTITATEFADYIREFAKAEDIDLTEDFNTSKNCKITQTTIEDFLSLKTTTEATQSAAEAAAEAVKQEDSGETGDELGGMELGVEKIKPSVDLQDGDDMQLILDNVKVSEANEGWVANPYGMALLRAVQAVLFQDSGDIDTILELLQIEDSNDFKDEGTSDITEDELNW